jgi:hypothetical protein
VSISPPWLRVDHGGGRFCLRTYLVSVKHHHDDVANAVTNHEPSTPEEMILLSTIWHELHHWLAHNCSSFGLFLSVLNATKVGLALQLLHFVQAKAPIKKPVITQVETIKFDRDDTESVEALLTAYQSSRRLIEVLIGLDDDTVGNCETLFGNVLPFMWTYSKGLDVFSGQKLTESMAAEVKGYFRRDTPPPQDRADELRMEEFAGFITEVAPWLRSSGTFGNERVSPEIRFHERLSWATLAEGWAKYFEFNYAAIVAALLGIGEFEPDLSWEKWDSVYVRAFRTYVEIAGRRTSQYEPQDILHFLALADLAANPSMDANWVLPLPMRPDVRSLMPGHRFIMAANASSRVQPMAISGEMIENHRAEPEYKRFIGEVCNKLEWETPWDQAARWLSRYRTWPEFDGIYPFLAGLRLRLEKPLFFGLPNFFFESTGESWNNYLQRLPIPPFADGKGEPLYWVSPDHTHPSTTALMYTRAMGVLVDDIILNAGPIDWEAAVAGFGTTNVSGAVANLQLHLRLHGIDSFES